MSDLCRECTGKIPETSSQRNARVRAKAKQKFGTPVVEEGNNKGLKCPMLGCDRLITGAFDTMCADCKRREADDQIAAFGGIDLASGSKSDGTKLRLNVLRASDVEMKKLDWLWRGYIPAAKPVLFAGKGDCGKSTVSIDLAARVSTGREFPDGSENKWGPKRVLMAVTEDALDDTVVPKLVAAGADLDMIGFLRITVQEGDDVKQRKLQMQTDIKLVNLALKERPEYALVILDPMYSFFGKGNKNDDEIMRPLMEEMGTLCAETKTTFVGIIHYNKKSELDAVQGISGAGAIGNVVRVIWGFAQDPDNKEEFFMSKAKGNILPPTSKGLKYKIVDAEVKLPDGDTDTKGKIEWVGKHDLDANDVMKAQRDAKFGGGGKKVSKGVELIKELLASTPRKSPEIYDALTAAGIGERTQKAAIREAGVHHNKTKVWWMSLPPNCPTPCKDCGTAEKVMQDQDAL